MSENIRVVVLDGAKVTDITWESVSVSRQLGTCAGTFRVQIASPREGLLRNGQKVGISAGNRILMVGYVETSKSALERGQRTFEYSGRETTCDLVDCTAPTDAVNLVKTKSLRTIAAALALKHGIEVRSFVPDPRVFENFALRPDESCWSVIERAARLRGAMVQGDGQGNLEIIEVGTRRAAAALVAGVNVVSAEFTSTTDERFRLYRVLGQRPGSGDRGWKEDLALAAAEAEDLGVTRPRTLVIVAEDSVDGADAQDRANWEATVRAARSTVLRAGLVGWRQDHNLAAMRGTLNPVLPFWTPNLIVPVELDPLGITEDLLCDDVTLDASRSGGSRTTLQCVRKDAYRALTEKLDVAEHASDELEDE